AFAVAVSSATTLTATTNSGTPGVYDVIVTNPDTQAGTLAGAFTLDAAPAVASLSPIGGSTAGGTVVTLTGAGFRTGAEVLFGSTPATAVTVVSDTELTATTAMHPIGVVSVTVRNTDGQTGTLDRSFRFVDPPSLTAIAPASGDAAGGTTVRLTGAGFSASATVTFGGTAATQVTLVSGTELDVVAPAHATGAVDVAVTVDGATATLAGAFTYTRGAPSVAAAAPATGPIEGGTLVTITGSGFADGATVTFGGTPATGVVVASADLLRAVAPAHAAGAVDIVVTNDDSQAGTLSGGFRYTAASGGPDNSITDGGSGAVGTDPTSTPVPGGVSCGCTSFDGSMFGFAGLGLVALLSRRRRRS
ncbi:MAG: IPT/TIG domain-containing protein, partial [Archangium sp.]